MRKIKDLIFIVLVLQAKYFPTRYSFAFALLSVSSFVALFKLESESFLYAVSLVVFSLISVISAVMFYKQINIIKEDI